jgi:uncharacterized protein (DUF433 family)
MESKFFNDEITIRENETMKDDQLLKRITLDPKVMVGKPVIRGTRLTVEYILNLLGHGSTVEEIIMEYKGLTREDVQACILFATKSLEDTSFMPLTMEMA